MVKGVIYSFVCLVVLLTSVALACAPAAAPPTPGSAPSQSPGSAPASPSAPSAQEPYLVGVTADVTGPFGNAHGKQGVWQKVYFDELNKKGGINGHPVKVLLDDSRSDPVKAASHTQSYIDQNVALMYNLAAPACLEASIAKCTPANMPLITHIGMPQSEAPKPNPVVFNLQNGAILGLGGGVGHGAVIVAQQHGIKSLKAIGITFDLVSSRMGLDFAAQLCRDYGMTADRENVPVAMTDFQPLATKIKTGNYDLVMISAAGPTITGTLSALVGLGWKGFFVTSSASPPDIMLTQFKLEDKFYVQDPVLTLDMPPDGAAMAKANGLDVNTFSTQGYTMAQSIEKILKDTGWPATHEKVLATMNNFYHDRMPYLGPLKWSPDDHIGDMYRRTYTWTREKGVITYGPIFKLDGHTKAVTDNPPELSK